ncbi:MAG: ATP-binding domain-containing protein, partial [Bacteroidales bacterium]|nr:ATP-binding domain-containing protein [Bacteroidales bacterium]
YGSISFYQRKEIKDMLAYLRMLVNPKDEEALKRVINYPARGIGKTTMNKLELAASDRDISIWEVMFDPGKYNVSINRGTEAKLNGFINLITEYKQKVTTSDAYQLAYELASASGVMKDLYSGNTPEERSKYENLEALLNGIRDFMDNEQQGDELITIDKYLENVSLLTDQDNEKEEDRNKVSMMTIHAAKGLEFKNIYICGVEEELFPSHMSMESEKDLEEERRLFYVAVTRAMKKVTITYTQSRYKWGTPTDCQPSRFISEIDEQYVDWQYDPRKVNVEQPQNELGGLFGGSTKSTSSRGNGALRAFGQKRPTTPPRTSNANFKANNPKEIQMGMMVEHQRFGFGKIVHMEGDFPDKKATVFFQDIKQEKQLLLKFAKLRIVKTS